MSSVPIFPSICVATIASVDGLMGRNEEKKDRVKEDIN